MEIKLYEKNAKKHPEKQLKQLAKIVKEVGWRQNVEVNQKGVIIAGHGRYLAWEKYKDEYKLPDIWITDDTGATIQGEHATKPLTEEQEKMWRIADNTVNAMSDMDLNLAMEDLKEMSDEMLNLTGYSKDLLVEEDQKDDEVPETPEEPKSKLGDLYEFGGHRVLCGDSTKIDDVEKLMDGQKADLVVTDPPYNTGMQGKPGDEKARLSHMFNDKIENWEQFIKDFLANYYANTKGECAYYVFIDWRKVNDIRAGMEELMDVKNVIVWDKKVHSLGSDYKSTYELCIVGKKGNPEISNRFGLDYQDIWRLQREMGRNKDHATAKPVELLEKPIKHASKEDDIVLDLFLGSGSTLIASQKTGRICYGMELDVKYCDVIVQRYVDYTGNATIKKNGQEIIWQK